MEQSHDKRKHPRWQTDQFVRVDVLGNQPKTLFVRIIEVSQHGLRLRGIECACLGAAIAIKVGHDLLLGEVVWCAHGEAGVVLEHALDLLELERLLNS